MYWLNSNNQCDSAVGWWYDGPNPSRLDCLVPNCDAVVVVVDVEDGVCDCCGTLDYPPAIKKQKKFLTIPYHAVSYYFFHISESIKGKIFFMEVGIHRVLIVLYFSRSLKTRVRKNHD